MKVYSDQEIRQLRKEKRVTDIDGQRLKPVLPREKPKTVLTSEDRQAIAMEAIVTEIKGLLQANSRNAGVLLEMIRKIKTEPIKIPEWPEPKTEWEHTITARDSSGKAFKMRSKAIQQGG